MAQPVLSALNIYPLKFASGISLKNSEMEQRGFCQMTDDGWLWMTHDKL